MGDFINKETQIAKVEEEADKIKVRDIDNVLYTIWKNKKDGNMTIAYDLWGKIPDQFMPIKLSYTETPYEFTNKEGKVITGTHKNITSVGWSADGKPGHMAPKEFHPAQKIEEKVETDKQLRESIMPTDNLQDRIRWGNAMNCASRQEVNTDDPTQKIDRIEAMAIDIYKRLENPPTADPMEQVKEAINTEDDTGALDSLIEEFGSKDLPSDHPF